MLEVRGLSVAYGKHRALEDVSIRVSKGEIVVILGANGAGKSTLLRAIGGICSGHADGHVEMDGHPILGLAPDRIVDHGIALVPEGRGIFGDLSVRDNLLLGAYSARARDDEAANLERVLHLFPKLAERQSQVARTMSGGEQQMVAIGRAIMSNPRILLLDEPSLGLSPLLCRDLFASLGEIRKSGIGVLLVEQNAKQSLAIADRGYLLENAHIVHEDDALTLASDPAVQKAYLGAGGSAGRTSKAAAHPAAPSAPAAAKPVAVDPRDIAAAALASLKTARPNGAASPPQPRQADDVAKPPKRAQPKPAAPARRSADQLAGASIGDLVASASQKASRLPHATTPVSAPEPARLQDTAQPMVRRPAPMAEPVRPSVTSLPPDLTHEQRLRAILDEIGAAAQAARNRPRR